jgi:hypothetical protein
MKKTLLTLGIIGMTLIAPAQGHQHKDYLKTVNSLLTLDLNYQLDRVGLTMRYPSHIIRLRVHHIYINLIQ